MMRPRDLPTIKCPHCGRTLPPNVLNCHFCGGDLAFVARPEAQVAEPDLKPDQIKFEKLYRGVAIYWIVDGVLAMLVGLHWLPAWASGLGGALFSYLGVAVTTGFLITVLGIGMYVKVPMARWIVGAFCWLRVITGLTGIGIVLRTGDYQLEGHNIYILAALNLLDTAFAIFQIWLLHETDYEVLN